MSRKSTDLERAILLEREAHRLRTEQKTEEAFSAYDEAASLFARSKEHFKASTPVMPPRPRAGTSIRAGSLCGTRPRETSWRHTKP